MPIRLDYQAYDSLLFISVRNLRAGTGVAGPGRLPDWRPQFAGFNRIEDRSPSRRPAQNLTTHRKRDCNRRVNFHRVAVQLRRFVAPLFHGIQSCLHQERVTGDHFELGNLAVLVNDRVKNHVTLNARLPRQRWIERLGLCDDRRRRHVTALLDARGSCRLRWRRSHSRDHALTWNAAEYAAG